MSELGLSPWLFRMGFSVLDYAGASSEIELYADSTCIIELVNGASGVYDPIASTKATFRFRVPDEATALSLYVGDDRDVKMELLYDPTGTGTVWRRLWTGWGSPTDLKVRYGTFPTVVEMSAGDGLSTLKDRPLLDSAGKRLSANNNLITLSNALRTALSQVGYEVPVTTGLNLYELTDMAAGQLINGHPDANKDPLYQTSVLAQSLVTDQNATINCYELLKRFEVFGLRIGQANGSEGEGDFYAMRVPDLAGGNDPNGTADTIRTRRYNNTDYASRPNVGTSISRKMIVEVGVDKSVRVKKRTQSTGLTSIKHAVRVEQSFGRQLSAIPNGDFSAVDAQNFPAGWVRGNLSNAYRQGVGSETDPFRFTLFGNSNGNFGGATPRAMVSIPFSKLHPDFSKTFKRTLKCNFKCNEVKGGSLAVIALSKGSWHILETGGSWRKGYREKDAKTILTEHFYTVNNVQKAKPGEGSVTLEMDGLSEVEEIQIYLCVGVALDRLNGSGKVIGPYDAPNPLNMWVSYYNLALSEEQVGLNLTGTQYTVSKPNRIAETVASFTWGDVPDVVKPYNRTGTLFRTDTATPTSGKWFRAVETFPVQTGRALLQIAGQDRAKQQMIPAPTFEGTLCGRLPYGLFTVMRIDDVADRDGKLIPSVLTRWRWDTRRCEHEVTAHRAMNDKALPVSAAPLPEWQTPDGPIPMATDDGGNLLTPEANKQIQQLLDQLKVLLPKLGVSLPGVAELPGHSAIDGGSIQIGARILQDDVVISEVQSVYRRDLAPDWLQNS